MEDSVTADKSNHGSGKNGNLSIAENSFSRLDYNEDLNESVEEVNDNIEDVGEVSYGSHNMLSTSRQKVLSFTGFSIFLSSFSFSSRLSTINKIYPPMLVGQVLN